MRLRKIMIVEDEALLAQDEATIVRDMTRADVVIVHTLAAAKREAASGDIDLALLDITLPDGEVFEVADMLHVHATPYVFITAYGRPDIPLRHRAAPLIGKPFRETDLRAALTRLIVPPIARHSSSNAP